ncbi:hypothetical protein NOVOSPHI9U_200005 [Novosphingobium sp. 9U]|nr:hypothetical protein NOVOSPHI9U_200005 [Novosphingobium sp. 9U]
MVKVPQVHTAIAAPAGKLNHCYRGLS